MSSKSYDIQVGSFTCDADYCEVCENNLITSSERNIGICSDCLEKKQYREDYEQ